jgi:hypothetical protein
MDNYLLVSLFEAIYVVYMLNFFKTRYNLAHPATYFENKLLYHPVGRSQEPVSNICQLGHSGAYAIAFYVLLRALFGRRMPVFKILNKLVVFVVFILSLLNFNALVYLLPYFAIEYLVISNKLK